MASSSSYAESGSEEEGFGARAAQWAGKCARQTRLLLVKNWIIAKRSRRETAVQLLVPVVMIVSLWILSFAYAANQRFNEAQSPQRTPGVKPIAPYPRCISGRQTIGPCISIAWVLIDGGSVSAPARQLIERVVERIRAEASLPAEQVREFASETVLDEYLLSHPNSTQGAYMFNVTEPAVVTGSRVVEHVGYKIQYNQTAQTAYGLDIDTQQRTLLPMTAAVERALLAELGAQIYTGGGGVDADIVYDLKQLEFARPEEYEDDMISRAGPTFIFSALMFNFVIVLANVVTEKENHLRQSMRVMGLRSLPYWLSWGITAFLFNLLSVVLVVVTGSMLVFRFFLENDFRTYFFLFLLFSLALVPIALFVSLMVKRASSATSIGFLLFLAGTVSSIFSDIVYGASAKGTLYPVVFSFFPPVVFTHGMRTISSYSDSVDDSGMSWSQRSVGDFPLTFVYNWLIADLFVYTILLWYVDTIVSAQGKQVRFWFPLLPSYWGIRACSSTQESMEPSDEALAALGSVDALNADDPNVAAEVASAREGTGAFATRDGLRVFGIRKVFTSRKWCGLKKIEFVANTEVVFGVPPNSLLALLGHNGAGKSTLFNQLTGLLSPTEGDALVFGKSIKYEMDDIRASMGVCPQHDVLWRELTAAEHLRLYAQLKDLPADEIEAEVDARLADVGLEPERDIVAGAFSGGMRRRLSTAIAFTADPRIVFLDEPTTGTDSVSKRQMWALIERKKAGRVIVLTTHSMEEADVLSDKIAVMSRGRIVTSGTAMYLKDRYGTGTQVTIIPESEDAREGIIDFGREHLDGLEPVSGEEAGDVSFIVPHNDRALVAPFLKALESSKRDVGVHDVILSAGALEDVFLRVAELDDERFESGSTASSA